jgi:hypothetical protein
MRRVFGLAQESSAWPAFFRRLVLQPLAVSSSFLVDLVLHHTPTCLSLSALKESSHLQRQEITLA